jgi:hypothetical protein
MGGMILDIAEISRIYGVLEITAPTENGKTLWKSMTQ